MPVSLKSKLISFSTPWMEVFQLELLENWDKKQIRIPIDPETFKEQPVKTGEKFLIENYETNEKFYYEVTEVYLSRIQNITHYDVKKEFCPNFWESEKMLASFTGWDYEREYVKNKWNEWYKDKPQFQWENNPLVLVVELLKIHS